VGPIFTIFGALGHTADVITHVKFQVDRSKGLGSTGTQSRVFPIDFDRRPYNSVSHYRATLWYTMQAWECSAPRLNNTLYFIVGLTKLVLSS